MGLYQERVQETIGLFNDDNFNLGFRSLTDLILDTEDIKMFEKLIGITDVLEQNPRLQKDAQNKCLILLEELKGITLNESKIGATLITAESVEKIYGKNKFSLGPLSLEINCGQVIGLVGENGNGKTTLLRILAKEISYTNGSIHYGFEAAKKDDYELRTELIYIPQRTPKWYGAVKDNLKLTATQYGILPQENETWTLMLMIRFGLYSFRNFKWSELSSGYKMRFELARTFLRRPKLLLLDEPLANLDILSQQLILEDLRMLGRSITRPLGIILSSQQLYEVEKISDEVVFLKNGKYTSMNLLRENESELNFVIEIDVDCSKDVLLKAMDGLNIKSIESLGSNFMIEFCEVGSIELFEKLVQAKIRIKYYRDISSSTRRLFKN
jgi:ABC-2 type transport system ATP-binding protein